MDKSIIGGVVFAISGVSLLLFGGEELREFGYALVFMGGSALGVKMYTANKKVQRNG